MKEDMGLDSSIATVLREEFAELHSNWKMTGHPLIIMATTSDNERVPTTILDCFKYIIDFEVCHGVARQNSFDS